MKPTIPPELYINIIDPNDTNRYIYLKRATQIDEIKAYVYNNRTDWTNLKLNISYRRKNLTLNLFSRLMCTNISVKW